MKELNAPISAKGPSDGLMFRILVIIALLVLFGLFLYAIFGPLPNQKNFVTSNSNSGNGVFPQLTVAGTSTFDKGVEAKSTLNVDGTTTLHDLNFVTTNGNVDTIQGKIIPTTNNLDIRSTGRVKMTNNNGSVTSAIFNSNGATDFIGDANMSARMNLINTDFSYQYNLFNDSASKDLIVTAKNNASIKNIFNAKVNGDQINLLKDSTAPLLYVGTGNGRVYDTVYNLPPTANPNPTFNSLAVITGGATTLGGTLSVANVLTSNGDLNINTAGGAGLNIKNGTTTLTRIANGNISLNDPDAFIDFTNNTAGKNHYISFGGASQRIIAFNNGGIFAQDDFNFTAQNQTGNSGIGKFDTRQIGYSTGQRNPFSEPFLNLNNEGSLKFSLPLQGVNPFSGNQENYYSYIAGTNSLTGGTWPDGSGDNTILGLWDSTQNNANNLMFTSTGGKLRCFWQCPKKGMWFVEFYPVANLGVMIGNRTTGAPFGTGAISTTVYMDVGNQVSCVYIESGAAVQLIGSILKFTLISELN